MELKGQSPQLGNYLLSATDVADILWLAAFLTPPVPPTPPPDGGDAADVPEVERGEVLPRPAKTSEPEPADTTPPAAEEPTKPTVADVPKPTVEAPKPDWAGRVYSPEAQRAAQPDDRWGGMTIQVPLAPAIPDKPVIIRSLRPLQRRVASLREWALAEAETADQVAAAILGGSTWLPVQYPVQERWLDLMLLVDGSPSMAVWQQTVDELDRLLTNIGIFRNVVRWTLAMVEGENGVNDATQTRLYVQPATATGETTQMRQEATHLIDAQQRRLFLVVSDCSSVVWDNGAAQHLLQPLARHNLVSLLQLLPEGLWESSGLGLATAVRLTTPQPLASNGQLKRLHGREAEQPIPVVSLEAAALTRWARFVVGRESQTIAGYYLAAKVDKIEAETNQLLRELGIEPAPAAAPSAPDIAAVYAAFRRRVPRDVQPLAAYWAAAPLTLPVMRLVQAAMMPTESSHANFVRVFYSGLIRRTTAQTEDQPPMLYDFVGGEAMRQHLLTMLPRYAVEQVVELVIAELSRYVRQHIDQHASFTAVLGVPGVAELLAVDPTARHFAEVTRQVLRYLGGVYASLADRLEWVVTPAELRQAASKPSQMAQTSEQLWRRIQEQLAAIVADVETLTVASTVMGDPNPLAQTKITAAGDITTTSLPSLPSHLRQTHEALVKTAVSWREKLLTAVVSDPTVTTPPDHITTSYTIQPTFTAPPHNIPIPHIVQGAPPLSMYWCWVPGGTFTMGSSDYENEKPKHQVEVSGFWLARYPVTNEQYRLFIEANGYKERQWWTAAGWKAVQSKKWTEPRYWNNKKWNDSQQPVVGVSWFEAMAFCRWATAAAEEPIRLPTEAEWEKAARSSDGRRFPWGNAEPTDRLCHFNQNWQSGSTKPVGQHSPQGDSPFGCADVAGNVYDWCLSAYQPYPYQAEDGRNDKNGSNVRVARGGSWYSYHYDVGCASRSRNLPQDRLNIVGFRCANTAF